MTQRRDEHRRYLSSGEWSELRGLALTRSNGRCELCGAKATQVHHVRYPKRFTEDHIDNLLALCDQCHDKQHGIRVDRMNADIIASAPRKTFVFGGRLKEYAFDFVMLNRRPWVPIDEIEKVLYHEDGDRGNGPTKLKSNGKMLGMYAGAHLSPDHRFIDSSGSTWLSVSGTTQILARRDEPACVAFREQLGDWLERQVIEADEKMSKHQQAVHESAQVAGNGLQMFKALVVAMEEHQQRIAQATDQSMRAEQKSDTALEVAQSTNQLVRDFHEIGFSLAADFLERHAPDVAAQNLSKDFGAFLAKAAKDRGAKKGSQGWVHSDGRVLSKSVPAPGTMYSNLNKWNEDWMSACLPLFIRHINPRRESSLSWPEIVDRLQVGGLTRQLVSHSSLIAITADRVSLALDPNFEHLRSYAVESRLRDALCEVMGREVRLDLQVFYG
ncbi:MAG: hypothetical protein EOM24_25025 [Chloroflexia bacterium]|nr:hypothetical protein [Chloroflexia bacterium]